MRFFFLLFIALPVLELIGFAVIWPKLGFLRAVAWLILGIVAGSMVIKSVGTQSFKRVQSGEDVFLVPDLFDAFCRLLAGILLIFPGFISDFLALLFLVPVLRRFVFRLAGTQQTPSHTAPSGAASRDENTGDNLTIEGDYRRIDRE